MGLMKTASWAFSDHKHFESIQVGSRGVGRVLRGKKMGPVPVPIAERWLKYRDVDAPPTDTFRTWWKKNREEKR